MFFVLFPVTIFDYIAEMSQKYAFVDWVAPVEVVDHDGNIANKKRLQPCAYSNPKKRYRAT